MANNRFKLENMLICSYAHLKSLRFKAYFKATKDLQFDGLPNNYETHCMTRMLGNRYLMNAINHDTRKHESYCIDVDTRNAERLEMKNYAVSNFYIDGDYMLVARYDGSITILRDLGEISQIEFDTKNEACKNYHAIRGRYAQHVGPSVYAVDDQARLYLILWQDIKHGKYGKTLVKSNVENFYVDRRFGLATVYTNHTMSLPSDTVVDLKAKVDCEATWAIATCIAKCWIVCGDRDLDLDAQSIMACINRQGDIKSTLKLKLTSNGYRNYRDGLIFAGIYSLHQAYVSGRRGIMLAIERDGCCHLISVRYGRLSKLQSIASIVNVDAAKYENQRIVMSVTATGIEGEFIAGGWNWTRHISLKLK